jgi:hypothetical protein
VDNESNSFSSSFQDGDDNGHHVEDAADDADSGTVIHVDNQSSGFSSSFWDSDDNHHVEDAADKVDSGVLDFSPFDSSRHP